MAKLTEPMIIARTKCSDLNSITKLNCWGNDLTDVSMVQRMPNVEVLALSVNKISTLADFQFCNNLRELYLRKNSISSVHEVCYLQDLPKLIVLNLSENPCTNADFYRLSVVKALPQLQKLDEQEVTDEERRSASRQGRDLVHPEDGEVGQSDWSRGQHADVAAYYHDPRLANGIPPEQPSSTTADAARSTLQMHAAPRAKAYKYHAFSAGGYDAPLKKYNAFSAGGHDAPLKKARLGTMFFKKSEVSPGVTPPEMESPEPPRHYQDEYADRRNANYDNTRISPSEQTGYSSRHVGPSTTYQQHTQYQQCSPPVQYQQNAPTYYAQTPTSPESHAPTMHHRRRENHSPELNQPCTPPSPSTPPFPQANGGSPSEHERGPRCRADGEARLCSELPLYPCSHQEEEYYRANQQQQPRHRYNPQGPPQAIPTATRRKSRTSNILSAVLCLVKELDYQSLEVVDTTVNARMNELMHEHTE